MSKIFKNFPATFISAFIGATILAMSLALDLDIFERLIALFETIEHLEVDEIIIPLFILIIGISIDSYQKHNRKKKLMLIAETKLDYLNTIIRTVQDIVGNSMNNLVLYSLEAKETGGLSKESIKELDDLIQFTTNEINELANTNEIYEKEIGDRMFMIDTPDKNKKI
jgi:hypothetical protein